MKIFDRQKKCWYEEKSYGGKYLRFLYETVPGAFLLNLLISRPFFSRVCSLYYNSAFSVKDIEPFISEHNIDMSVYRIHRWKSFNDFFTRDKLSVPDSEDNELVSPCDGKLTAVRIGNGMKMNIKGTEYTVEELTGNSSTGEEYAGGYAFIYRLTADDCHVYRYFDEGSCSRTCEIKGRLHTVQDISRKYRVYKTNNRIVSELSTLHFGNVDFIEVGALLIGKIKNRNLSEFGRMDEKGRFEYGASTIVVLMKKNENLIIDSDIMDLSSSGMECRVRTGEVIGHMREENKDA